jgi:hypothetical protein
MKASHNIGDTAHQLCGPFSILENVLRCTEQFLHYKRVFMKRRSWCNSNKRNTGDCCHLGCCAMRYCRKLPTFWRNTLPPSSGSKSKPHEKIWVQIYGNKERRQSFHIHYCDKPKIIHKNPTTTRYSTCAERTVTAIFYSI